MKHLSSYLLYPVEQFIQYFNPGRYHESKLTQSMFDLINVQFQRTLSYNNNNVIKFISLFETYKSHIKQLVDNVVIPLSVSQSFDSNADEDAFVYHKTELVNDVLKAIFLNPESYLAIDDLKYILNNAATNNVEYEDVLKQYTSEQAIPYYSIICNHGLIGRNNVVNLYKPMYSKLEDAKQPYISTGGTLYCDIFGHTVKDLTKNIINRVERIRKLIDKKIQLPFTSFTLTCESAKMSDYDHTLAGDYKELMKAFSKLSNLIFDYAKSNSNIRIFIDNDDMNLSESNFDKTIVEYLFNEVTTLVCRKNKINGSNEFKLAYFTFGYPDNDKMSRLFKQFPSLIPMFEEISKNQFFKQVDNGSQLKLK